MSGAVLHLAAGRGRKSVDLPAYLDAAAEEHAQSAAIAWIKQLRHADVDGTPMRRRFSYRGDSLWWFTEIYLHKQQVILNLFRTISALERLVAQEQPQSIELERSDRLITFLAPRVAAAHGIEIKRHNRPSLPPRVRIARLHARARWLNSSARAGRARARRMPRPSPGPAIAAFVHRAFLRKEAGTAEAYIGPVLQVLEQRLDAHQLAYVSLGPSENFSARRWWHALTAEGQRSAVPSIESYAPLERLEPSRAIWTQRLDNLRALWNSRTLREASLIGAHDCWPVIREELAGVALLQWPWSARAMDEAGAALDTLEPAAVLTYAEAGGWGRALMLECRRRRIPSAGLQHGFIYRHWLNYLHEPDEMSPDPELPSDGGFPRPDRTLLFDDYARQHLVRAGRFPEESLAVTGSPRLDALVAANRGLAPEQIETARAGAGAEGATLLLVVTKFREARRVLPDFLDAIASMPDVRVAIKAHPAETPDVYAQVAAGRPNVSILSASAALAPLLRASRAVVTVNSTVALDAAVLGIPALVIGLPNNLSPFVEAGAMAGADAADLPAALQRILYDQSFRLQLEHNRAVFLSRFRIGSDGQAAGRSAEAILQLAARNE